MSTNTQATDILTFPSNDILLREELKNRLIMKAPIVSTVPNSNPPINFKRIPLAIRNPDNTEGDLVIITDRCFSFGVSESKDIESGKLNGYSMAISMYNRDKPTELQLRTVAFINALSDVIKEYLLQDTTKEALELYELDAADLKKLNPLYIKRVQGKPVEGASPAFYPKLHWIKAKDSKPESMRTRFYPADVLEARDLRSPPGETTINPLDYIGTLCEATSVVKFDSIFLGAKTKNIQCKLLEAEVTPLQSIRRSFLRR